MQDVANRLMQDFTANLGQMIAGPAGRSRDGGRGDAPAPTPVLPETPAHQPEIGPGWLVLSVLGGRVKALL